MKNNNSRSQRRYKIISLFSIALFILLTIRLATLTIARGSYFREKSENMRIKDIYVTAPRGEIRDRNGILLAGNKPMFTLQILKDEFTKIKSAEKNNYILRMITLLEEDGINYSTEFPINLNNFSYQDNSDYFKTELSPTDRVMEIIMDNNLVGNIIDKYFSNISELNEFYYYPAQNILNSLEFNSKHVPIKYEIVDGKLDFKFFEGIDLDAWYKTNNIPVGTSARDSLVMVVNNDKTIIKKMLSHPINRMITYNILAEKELAENIVMTDFEVSYRQNYLSNKLNLMAIYPEINMETTAEQDFIILFKENSLRNFLKYEIEEEGINIIEIVKELFNENNVPIFFDAVVNDGIPYYFSLENSDLDEAFVLNRIANSLIENKLVGDLINKPNVATYAQRQLISDGINPGISINEGFEYVTNRNLENFKQRFSISNDSSNEEIYKIVRDYYSIDENLSIYEVYGMLNVYNELSKQGHLAYMPINFSYGLKDKTVAKVEEQLSKFDGFIVSIEPVRYYPEGDSASHILGYMGKISQNDEIEEYINKNKYSPDTLIGKTGIEQSFQKNLYGENGYRRVEVDSLGNTSNILEEIKPKPGDNVYLSIDHKLQKRAEFALESILRTIRTGGTVNSPWGDFNTVWSSDNNRPYKNATSGAVMAVDVVTGEVLAMTSYPAYDPNLFSTGISSADWEGLIPEDQDDPLAPRPLYNVATQTAIQPGSTFKMVTALAALEKGMDPKTKIDDRGYIEIGDTKFGCWIWNEHGGMHGRMNLVDAIRDSCNYYFYTLATGENLRTGEKIEIKLDIDDISLMANKLGLGSKTGIEINIPQEAEPGVPNPVVKTEVQKRALRSWLNANIDRFYTGNQDFNDELKKSVVDSIVAWIDLDELPSLDAVYRGLTRLELDGTMRVSEASRNTLADIIKFTYLNSSKWTIADTINITIGQGSNSYTLSQMTNYVATIANDGYKNKLTLVSNIKNHDNTNTEFENEKSTERIELNNYDNLGYLREGMRQASLTGQNKAVFENFPVSVGIKTGTAQRSGINPVTKERYDSFAYEVAFAPYDNPRIAVAVVIFQGGAGANCSPIVREVIAEYMGLYREEETDNLPIEMNIIP